MNISNILNKTVIAIKGYNIKCNDKRVKHPIIDPEFILFDDGETYIELEEQDYYSFHDCSSCAREITVHKDKERWNDIMTGKQYEDSTR